MGERVRERSPGRGEGIIRNSRFGITGVVNTLCIGRRHRALYHVNIGRPVQPFEPAGAVVHRENRFYLAGLGERCQIGRLVVGDRMSPSKSFLMLYANAAADSGKCSVAKASEPP